MEPVTTALVGGAAAQGAAGILGELLSARDKAQQRMLLERYLAELRGMELPELKDVNPDQLGATAFSGLENDADLSETRAAQLEAMNKLKELYDSGGMTLADKANQTAALNDAAIMGNAARRRTENAAAERGTLGSGLSFAAQLQGQQASANQAANVGLQTAASAQARAMQALKDRASMAAGVRGQDLEQKSRIAQARDMVSQYNADARNRSKYFNVGQAQQQFQNAMAKQNAIGNATVGAANAAGAAADDTRGLYAGIGQAAAEAGQTAYRAGQKKPRYGY